MGGRLRPTIRCNGFDSRRRRRTSISRITAATASNPKGRPWATAGGYAIEHRPRGFCWILVGTHFRQGTSLILRSFFRSTPLGLLGSTSRHFEGWHDPSLSKLVQASPSRWDPEHAASSSGITSARATHDPSATRQTAVSTYHGGVRRAVECRLTIVGWSFPCWSVERVGVYVRAAVRGRPSLSTPCSTALLAVRNARYSRFLRASARIVVLTADFETERVGEVLSNVG